MGVFKFYLEIYPEALSFLRCSWGLSVRSLGLTERGPDLFEGLFEFVSTNLKRLTLIYQEYGKTIL